jgi:hypothetical protein
MGGKIEVNNAPGEQIQILDELPLFPYFHLIIWTL